MEIAIFTELTTNDHLNELKAESEKYTGLYVDMNIAKERKYVKDKAADIKSLLGKVERLRIDATADYKIKVEAEAADIKERLEIANLPFTLLIDEYAVERKKILDAEKAEKLAIEIAVKLEADHEFALLINDKHDNEKALEQTRLAQAKIDSDALIAKEAKEKAERLAQKAIDDAEAEKQKAIDDKIKADADLLAAQAREKLLNEQAAQDKLNTEWLAYISEAYKINDDINEQIHRDYLAGLAEIKRIASIETERLAGIERARLAQKAVDDDAARLAANTKHCGNVHRTILDVLIANGITEKDGKIMIKLAAKKKLPQLTINY